MSFNSFIESKSLICRSCNQQFRVDEEHFPSDLFSLLVQYNIPQIHWFCKICNNYNASPENLPELFSRISSLEKAVCELKDEWNSRFAPVYDNQDVQLYQSSSSFHTDSTGSLHHRRSSGFESTYSSPVPNLNTAKSPSVSGKRSLSSSPPNQSLRSLDRSPDRSTALRVINTILNTEIKIDKSQASNSIAVVDAFMNKLNPFLKENYPVYKYLYSKDYKTGSSFNDLKISSADEYDINIVLVPPGEFQLKVEFFEKTNAFSKIKWSKVKEVPESRICVMKFFESISDDQGYLKPLKLRHWFQSLIAKFCDSKPKIKGIKKFISSESGPARTIKIDTDEGYSISLDLVPVFTFGFDILSKDTFPMLEKYPLDSTKAFCSFVPKLCEDEEDLSNRDCILSWRTYIPEIDKKVWYNKQCAKNLIKLLKLLRDKEDWKNIASYHMATVVLWEIYYNSDDKYWNGPVLFDRFIQALEKLQEYLSKKYLPYFVYPKYNLFYKLNKAYADNISHRIQHILRSLKLDPNNLTIIFKLGK